MAKIMDSVNIPHMQRQKPKLQKSQHWYVQDIPYIPLYPFCFALALPHFYIFIETQYWLYDLQRFFNKTDPTKVFDENEHFSLKM